MKKAAKEKDKMADAMNQARAQFESIKEMVDALNAAGDDDAAREEAERAIHEGPLSVLVRGDWHEPGAPDDEPGEFEILLCTGGPAVRLIGDLGKYGLPTINKLRIEAQDGFQPWTTWQPSTSMEAQDILVTYARCFYFGE